MFYPPSAARIVRSAKLGAVLRTTLVLDRIPSSPIAPASLYDRPDGKVAALDLHMLVSRQDDLLAFEPLDPRGRPLTAKSVYYFISWWQPYQLEVAQDTNRTWRKQTFESKDMLARVGDGCHFGHQVVEGEPLEGELVKGGWDHEHCLLCWKKISPNKEEELNEGYTDGKEWLCQACYELYVASGFGERLGEYCR